LYHITREVLDLQIFIDDVTFDAWDLHFVEEFGVFRATEMVLDFFEHNRHPFLYDTYQLAHFLQVEQKQLLTILGRCDTLYRKVKLPKKNGGVRIISAPLRDLKQMQKIILEHFLKKLPVSEHATAYKEGGTIRKNASVHCGKKYLLKLDIEDFFDCISAERVYKSAFHTQYFPQKIGKILTRLCTKNGYLPQGAPTSPMLSNLVMRPFDMVMGNWCKKHNIGYTRYCDDITFSADVPLYVVYVKAKSLLEKMDFCLNEEKTKFIRSSNRQVVTGLTVNECIHVTADYKRKLRQEIHFVLKFGLKDALLHTTPNPFVTEQAVHTERYYQSLMGRIHFVLQIEPENRYFLEAEQKLKGINH